MKIILLLFLAMPCLAEIKEWDTTLYIVNDPSITVAWDCNLPEARTTSHYDVYITMEDKEPNTTYQVGTTTECQMIIPQPRAGHFFITVNACNFTACQGATSKNDQITTKGFTKGWRIYWKVAPPIPIDRHLEPVIKDPITGRIIVPVGGFRSGIPAPPANIRLIKQDQTCNTAGLKEGMWFHSNNPEKNIIGLVAMVQTDWQWRIIKHYIFPQGQLTEWIHMYFRFVDLGLNPCVRNDVLFRYEMADNSISYNSFMECYGIGCFY